MKYRSKPVEIDAWRHDAGEMPSWVTRAVDGKLLKFMDSTNSRGTVWNSQEKIWIPFNPDHWIVLGTAGEIYPCSDLVFKVKYEAVG